MRMRFRVSILAATLLCLALLIGPLAAQSPRETRNATPGVFDFYVLALSWSPSFCALSGRRNKEQCGPEGRIGKGFVVHGLWPQFMRGYPSQCAAGYGPTRAAVAAAVPPFPTEGLARYQWRKHGSCSGLSPTAYFEAVKAASALVTIPPPLRAVTDEPELAPIAIERFFAEANQRLRPDMMAVQCERGLFEEIRICLSKDLKGFVTCQEVDRATCRDGTISFKPMQTQ
jgi:ribonuclease T2